MSGAHIARNVLTDCAVEPRFEPTFVKMTRLKLVFPPMFERAVSRLQVCRQWHLALQEAAVVSARQLRQEEAALPVHGGRGRGQGQGHEPPLHLLSARGQQGHGRGPDAADPHVLHRVLDRREAGIRHITSHILLYLQRICQQTSEISVTDWDC